MPLGLKPCCAVCKTNSSSMWKKGNQGEILCNNCTGKSSSCGASGPSMSSNTQPSNGGGKQVRYCVNVPFTLNAPLGFGSCFMIIFKGNPLSKIEFSILVFTAVHLKKYHYLFKMNSSITNCNVEIIMNLKAACDVTGMCGCFLCFISL